MRQNVWALLISCVATLITVLFCPVAHLSVLEVFLMISGIILSVGTLLSPVAHRSAA